MESEGSGLIGKRVYLYRKSRYNYGQLVKAGKGVIEAFNRDEGLYPENMKHRLPGDGMLIVRHLKANGERSAFFDSFWTNDTQLPRCWEFESEA
jgi:hypothetical protein